MPAHIFAPLRYVLDIPVPTDLSAAICHFWRVFLVLVVKLALFKWFHLFFIIIFFRWTLDLFVMICALTYSFLLNNILYKNRKPRFAINLLQYFWIFNDLTYIEVLWNTAGGCFVVNLRSFSSLFRTFSNQLHPIIPALLNTRLTFTVQQWVFMIDWPYFFLLSRLHHPVQWVLSLLY